MHAEFDMNAGMKALGNGKASDALGIFSAILREQPGDAAALYWKAKAEMELGKREESLRTLDQLLKVDPAHRKGQAMQGEILRGNVSGNAQETLVRELVAEAERLMGKGSHQEALDILNQAKSFRKAVENLDVLRAVCFSRLGDAGSVRQALYEELRYFPNNPKARELLSQLDAVHGGFGGGFPDREFQDLLKIIRPFTMLSEARLYSLFTLAKHVCTSNVPGNFVECGVAAGGSSALLGYVISKYSRIPRFLYCFDSFEGMPRPGSHDTHGGQGAESTGWGTGTCSAPEESVREVCRRAGVSTRMVLVKGYFEQTLPRMKDVTGMIALLHMDGDWYESTRAILENLYDHVVNDALIQVDDYGFWDGCRKAIHEFEKDRGITFRLNPIDGTGVWCAKPEKFPINSQLSEKGIREFMEDDPVRFGITSQMSPNERFQMHHVLSGLLQLKEQGIRTVEVGSFAGASLALTFRALKRHGLKLEMTSVEPSPQPQYQQVVEQIRGYMRHLPLFSNQAAVVLKDEFERDGRLADFIFIDGDHTYEGVKRDILDYYPLLASGGIIMFHDFLPALDEKNRDAILFHHGGKEPGIRQACLEVMDEMNGCKPLDLPLLYPTDPTQTQSYLPLIAGVKSTLRAYRKP